MSGKGQFQVIPVSVFCLVFVACAQEIGDHTTTIGPCRPAWSSTTFTVVTYNIHAGVGRDGKRDLARTAETLRGADIVGLQEVDNRRPRSGFENQARTLATRLGHGYWRHFPAEDYWPFGTYGNALTSSYPVSASDAFLLPVIEGKPPRRLAWSKVLVNCKPTHVFVIHVTRAEARQSGRELQVQAALAFIKQKTNRMKEKGILMGDLNLERRDPAIHFLRQHLVEVTSRIAGDDGRSNLIDYIFVWGEVEVLEAHIIDDGSSDHPAVFATLR